MAKFRVVKSVDRGPCDNVRTRFYIQTKSVFWQFWWERVNEPGPFDTYYNDLPTATKKVDELVANEKKRKEAEMGEKVVYSYDTNTGVVKYD